MGLPIAPSPPRNAASARPLGDPVKAKEIVAEWVGDFWDGIIQASSALQASDEDTKVIIQKLFLDGGYEKRRKHFGMVREEDLDMTNQGPVVVIIGMWNMNICTSRPHARTNANHSLTHITGSRRGAGGLATAAHLTHMGIKILLIERDGRVGDSWRKRYGSLILHDPVYADSLPYMAFPDTWPVCCPPRLNWPRSVLILIQLYTPKDKFADYLESYATLLDLNVWTDSNVVDVQYNMTKKSWKVTVQRCSSGTNSQTRKFCRITFIIQG
jgi:hypothetical protein